MLCWSSNRHNHNLLRHVLISRIELRKIQLFAHIHQHIMFDPAEIVVEVHNCAQCSHQTASAFQLDHHIQRTHNGPTAELFHAIVEPEQFSCISCEQYQSHYRFELSEHYNILKGENDKIEFREYPCEHCKVITHSSLFHLKHRGLCVKIMSLRKAKMVDTGEQIDRLECPHCLFRTSHKWNLKRHMLKHATDDESNWFQCGQCSYRTKQKSDLKKHSLNHVKDEKITWQQCNQCTYRSRHKSYLKRHIKEKHATDDEIYSCNQCSYRAKSKRYLKRHMLTHAKDDEINWFQCEHCSHRTKYNRNLKEHVMNAHVTNDKIQCSHCSYRTNKNSNLTRHMLKHVSSEEINWHRCGQCSYQAKRKAQLTSHMLRHATNEEIDWFQCNHCSYRAKIKSQLKSHVMLQHASEEEIDWFQCNHCSYRAKRKTHLSCSTQLTKKSSGSGASNVRTELNERASSRGTF